MCDPVSLIASAVTSTTGAAIAGGLALNSLANRGGGGSSVDPAAERAAAEAKAAQAANARIAAAQKRRQQSLLSSGAPVTDPGAPTVSRSSTSLMARGAQMGGGSGQVIL